ncbi:MAG: FAD-dependent oxidoreductase [Dehalococcoidales bacterium]
MTRSEAVLVIGAGVAGMKASLDMAEAGHSVYLCERKPSAGGTLVQMDKWFPDNHCSMCQILPTLNRDRSSQNCLRRGLVHPNVELLLNAEVTELQGEAGDFRATVSTRSTGVDAQLCTGCGLCTEVCPVEVESQFDEGLGQKKAIDTSNPYVTPRQYAIDWEKCTRCGECVSKCPTQAIRLEQEESTRQLQVGAVIVSTGFEEFDPHLATQYGYRRYPNVITSIELERLLSPGGPSEGELVRSSDGRAPASIAFLQCIGSRDSRRDYCSSACCMFAVKEATLIKKAWPQTDVHIFFMDLRAFGKGYYRYYERARDEFGVNFTRCRVPVVKEDPQTHNLVLTVASDDGAPARHQFEMVVLSVGQTPSPQFREFCQVLGVETGRWGFCQTKPFSTVETSREGVYVCGSAAGPKDIADTIVEAGAAAGGASKWLSPPAARKTEKKEEVEEQVGEEEPKTAVFLCGCGGEISSALDLEQLADNIGKLPGVVLVEQMPYLCYAETLETIKKRVQEHEVNRLLLGACAYINRPVLDKLAAQAGIDPDLIKVVNLREDIVWVHRDQPDKALAKANSLLAMALEDVRQQDCPPASLTPVTPGALVIGGGVAGMMTALSVAQHEIEVHLVERSPELGGNLKEVFSTLESGDTQPLLRDTIEQVSNNSHTHLHMESEVAAVSGYAGNFSVSIKEKDESLNTIEIGAIIVATGGDEYRTIEYQYGQNSKVITQHELENRLFAGELDPGGLSSVVMIQCVGSREKDRPYCSRVCCSQAVKNALKLKEANPEIEVNVLFRDMMSYGFKEEYYTRAREKGVRFIRYEPDRKPEVKVDKEQLTVELVEPVVGGTLVLEPDLVVLSTGVTPGENRALADILTVPLDEDGFFQEAEEKFRPVDFLREGIYVCGLAHSPRGVEETIAQARAAARGAVSLLTSKQLEAGRIISETVQRQCRKCEMCIAVCPYDARARDEETNEIVVREALCQGCGACVVACPSGAAKIRGFKDRQVFSLIDAAL